VVVHVLLAPVAVTEFKTKVRFLLIVVALVQHVLHVLMEYRIKVKQVSTAEVLAQIAEKKTVTIQPPSSSKTIF
jgi:hypothetical protein